MPMVAEFPAAALSNAGVFAPAALVLTSVAGLIRYKLAVSRVSVNFQLRSLESAELGRSMLLYKKVHERRAEIEKSAQEPHRDLLARYRKRKSFRKRYVEELEDIEAYRKHLRSMIVRLRRRPIQRLRCWLHVRSAELAFGRSLMAYAVICCVGVVELYCLQQLLLVDEMDGSFAGLSRWQDLQGPLLYANWIAAALMLATWPAVYLYRRAELNRVYRMQLRLCKGFAAADPDRLLEELYASDTREQATPHPDHSRAEAGTCFEVLGLSPGATIEEVKEAYRQRVKQSHPDRVRGMSSAFTALAEAETKKLNAAYQEALMALQGLLPA